MMGTFILICVVVAVVLVMSCGVWVAIALFTAVRSMGTRTDSVPDSSGKRELADGCSTPRN